MNPAGTSGISKVMLSVIRIRRPGFTLLFREKRCFITTFGDSFKLFGFNILAYEAALFVIWLTTFVFTLLLVHLFFESYVVTSVAAVVLNFLPFAFIYTFAGYRYPMATALAVVSLYFLHLGFRNSSRFLSVAGRNCGRALFGQLDIRQAISAGAGNCRTALRCVSLEELKATSRMEIPGHDRLWVSSGCDADPSLHRIQSKTTIRLLRSPSFVHDFWQAVRTVPFPNGIRPYIEQFRNCFFSVPALRLFHSRYFAYPAGILLVFTARRVLALWQKRFEIVLLAIFPVAGAFIANCL